MRRIGLSFRQFLLYAIIIVMTVLLLVIIISGAIKRYYIKETELNLMRQAAFVEEMLRDLPMGAPTKEVEELVTTVYQTMGTRVTVITATGAVIGDSAEDPHHMENHSSRPEIHKALRGAVGKSTRFSKILQEPMIYVALPIRRDDTVAGVVRTSLPLREVDETIGAINHEILSWTAIMIALALMLSLISSKIFTRPIRHMIQATKEIAGRDFTKRISTRRNDEFKQLIATVRERGRAKAFEIRIEDRIYILLRWSEGILTG